MAHVVESDSEGVVTLPGHPNRTFLMRVNSDGSLLLQPAHVVTEAQREYDTSSELQSLLGAAAQAPTLRRDRTRRS